MNLIRAPKLYFYVTLAVIHGFLLIPLPLLLKYVIDQLRNGSVHAIIVSLAWLAAISTVDIMITAVSRMGIVATVKDRIEALRLQMVEKVIRSNHKSNWQSYEQQMKDVIVQDTEKLDIAVTVGLGQTLPASISATVLFIVLWFISPRLWLISFGILPLCVVALVYTKKVVHTLLQQFHSSMNDFESRVDFLVRAWELVKTQTAEHMERDVHARMIGTVHRVSNALARQHIMLQVLQEGMGLLFGVLLLAVGCVFVSVGWLTMGQVVSFFVGFSLVRMQIAMIFTTWPQIITYQYAMERIRQLLAVADSTPYSGTLMHASKGELSLQNISLSIGERSILRNASALFPAGKLTVITGNNGEGKTTLLLALLGLLVPDSGEILVDGIPLSRVDIVEYRKQIGVVSQHLLFLDATVHENESYGVLADIEEPVMGWDDFIIDADRNVSSLSGGEQQRFMIMRALKRKPKILLLDEPTNHLDRSHQELFIMEIQKLLPSTTIICSTHDQKIIAIADRVYRLAHATLFHESRISN